MCQVLTAMRVGTVCDVVSPEIVLGRFDESCGHGFDCCRLTDMVNSGETITEVSCNHFSRTAFVLVNVKLSASMPFLKSPSTQLGNTPLLSVMSSFSKATTHVSALERLYFLTIQQKVTMDAKNTVRYLHFGYLPP